MFSHSLPVLVVATSARMLTKLLVDNGFIVIAIDVFGDVDTRNLSLANHCVDRLEGQSFMHLLLQVRDQYSIKHAFYGSGFESCENSLVFLEQHFSVIGNSSSVFSAIQHKADFFQTLKKLNLPHPQVCFENISSQKLSGLLKPYHSNGGIGVVFNSTESLNCEEYYWQEYIEGTPCSVLFVANGLNYKLIGFNQQLIEEIDKQPFVFAGLLTQIDLSVEVQDTVSQYLKRLVKHYTLKGLCSLDFMLMNEQVFVLEINARIPASAQLYGKQMMQWHIDAILAGNVPEQALLPSPKKMLRIIYSDTDIRIPADIKWPAWVFDRPPEGRLISQKQPICSIIIDCVDSDSVVTMLQHHVHIVKNHLLSGL